MSYGAYISRNTVSEKQRVSSQNVYWTKILVYVYVNRKNSTWINRNRSNSTFMTSMDRRILRLRLWTEAKELPQCHQMTKQLWQSDDSYTDAAGSGKWFRPGGEAGENISDQCISSDDISPVWTAFFFSRVHFSLQSGRKENWRRVDTNGRTDKRTHRQTKSLDYHVGLLAFLADLRKHVASAVGNTITVYW